MTLIAEGSPVHTTGRYYTCGRGGAGNYQKLSTLPAPPISIPAASPTPRFFGGRGGAGNVQSSSNRAPFSFEEELEKREMTSSNYSVGRGGAGNIVPVIPAAEDLGASARNSREGARSLGSGRSSTGSQGSLADRFLNRLQKFRSA
jgi:hypothetical protein